MMSYRGVRKRKSGQWVAEIHDPTRKKQIWLGSFKTAEMAAKAYDTYAFHLRDSKARLNFPENIPNLPPFPSDPKPHEIRMLVRQSVEDMVEIIPITFGLSPPQTISSSVVAPVTVTQSPSQIKALSEWPMYSPGNDNVGDFDPN